MSELRLSPELAAVAAEWALTQRLREAFRAAYVVTGDRKHVVSAGTLALTLAEPVGQRSPLQSTRYLTALARVLEGEGLTSKRTGIAKRAWVGVMAKSQ